ncbi:unnamed protein product [Sphagnum balticum]
MLSRFSMYVKANDARYGLKVASRDPKTLKFFAYVFVAFKNSIKAHFSSSSLGVERQIDFDINRNIVDTIVGNMLFDPTNEFDNNEDADVEDLVFDSEAELNAVMRLRLEAVATMKSRALALFKRIQFEANDDINDKAQFSYSGFSIVIDFATHQSTSYLDLRFCVFIEEHSTIVNLHGCALPMFDRHTNEVMFNMVSKFLTVFCPDWTIRLIGLASDGARNMTGRIVGVVTQLDVAMHDDYPLTRIWCGAHQLDLVMEHIMNDVVKDRFFIIMTGFIIIITRQ